MKKLPPLSKEKVREAFGSEKIIVHNNSHELFSEIKKMKSEYPVILLMSSGDFDGLDFDRLSEELLSDN
jgi:UDP-N-acetylmuramate: L-alanyl-gamma-D-glutamyl-meso-diaminopimelate ligase